MECRYARIKICGCKLDGFVEFGRVLTMVGDGRGSISRLDERDMIVMGHGRGMMSVRDGKVLVC